MPDHALKWRDGWEWCDIVNLAVLLLRVAVALLPVTHQARFFDEWRSELEVVHREVGWFAALGFVCRLIVAAPRMTLTIRADSETAYAELSIGLLFSIFPSTVLLVLGIRAGVWTIVLGELGIIIGILLMASGFWSFEGRLLDSTRSRVGIAFATTGSFIEIAVRRLTGFGPPIDAEVSATIPHVMIVLGLILWVASSYGGPYSYRILRLSVGLLAPGAALNLVVVAINGASLSGFDRFGVLMYLVPSAGLAWACYSIVGRQRVFDDQARQDDPVLT